MSAVRGGAAAAAATAAAESASVRSALHRQVPAGARGEPRRRRKDNTRRKREGGRSEREWKEGKKLTFDLPGVALLPSGHACCAAGQ